MKEPENIGEKFFALSARYRLRSLLIFPACRRECWTRHRRIPLDALDWQLNPIGQPERVYRAHCFHDAASAAIYEMSTLRPGWEWIGAAKSCALVLFNELFTNKRGNT